MWDSVHVTIFPLHEANFAAGSWTACDSPFPPHGGAASLLSEVRIKRKKTDFSFIHFFYNLILFHHKL